MFRKMSSPFDGNRKCVPQELTGEEKYCHFELFFYATRVTRIVTCDLNWTTDGVQQKPHKTFPARNCTKKRCDHFLVICNRSYR